MSTYSHLFGGTHLEAYAEELDSITKLHSEGEISDDEHDDLVRDIKIRLEMDEAVAHVHLTSDLLAVCNQLLKLI